MVPSGASTGRERSGRAARRRRSPLRRQGRAQGRAGGQRAARSGDRRARATAQREIDERLIELDGTPNKANLGANAIARGLARRRARRGREPVAAALSLSRRTVGGDAAGSDDERDQRRQARLGSAAVSGVHDRARSARRAKPKPCVTARRSFTRWADCLHDRGLPTQVGDEGGYAPPLQTPQQALDLIVAAIELAGYRPGSDVAIALDPASSEFYRRRQVLSALAEIARRASTR